MQNVVYNEGNGNKHINKEKTYEKMDARSLYGVVYDDFVKNGANAQDYSGSCGAQLRWSMSTTTGVLTITWSGPMDDYNYSAPWYNYYIRNYLEKIVVSPGCTSIGATAFSQLSELTDVTLPDTVASLGDECLKSCKKLTSITMPGVKLLGKQCFWNCKGFPVHLTYDGNWSGN